jgi:hypothetical protein
MVLAGTVMAHLAVYGVENLSEAEIKSASEKGKTRAGN